LFLCIILRHRIVHYCFCDVVLLNMYIT
jgi:hypothetical protein